MIQVFDWERMRVVEEKRNPKKAICRNFIPHKDTGKKMEIHNSDIPPCWAGAGAKPKIRTQVMLSPMSNLAASGLL
jgi:hypothetical protein